MKVICHNCGGFGVEEGMEWCPYCEGQGCIHCQSGVYFVQNPCHVCSGCGEVDIPDEEETIDETSM